MMPIPMSLDEKNGESTIKGIHSCYSTERGKVGENKERDGTVNVLYHSTWKVAIVSVSNSNL